MEKTEPRTTSKPRLTPQRTTAGWEEQRQTVTQRCALIPTRETMDWDLNNFEIVSYACGDKLDVNKDLTFDHFEYAYPMKMSMNTIDRKAFVHFFCTQGEHETFVVARLKQ